MFEGAWEGTLRVVGRHGAQGAYWLRDGANETAVRLTVRDASGRLDVGGRRYRAPDGFRCAEYNAAALVYATMSALDSIGTWQLSLTMLDAEPALVFAW